MLKIQNYTFSWGTLLRKLVFWTLLLITASYTQIPLSLTVLFLYLEFRMDIIEDLNRDRLNGIADHVLGMEKRKQNK